MSNRLFQGVVHQMKDAIDRTIGVMDENYTIIACSELLRIGETQEFETSVGGGAVSVKANGKKELIELTISPDAVDPDDVEMLQDMIMTAVNEVMRKADDAAANNLKSLTGGLNIPGLF